ncbi:MAG: hypothetical protein QHH10_09880 [Peptococcaceae bacterium]|jgi:hypothetical protein|nr:hypothetical protein [Peptococcaceae bacterium]MDH7525609.1 hypothetical protein [Peptococcaceae bacterium]
MEGWIWVKKEYRVPKPPAEYAKTCDWIYSCRQLSPQEKSTEKTLFDEKNEERK